MSVLGDKQRLFSRIFPRLLIYAESLGYEITFPPEHENHIVTSLHFRGLAKDINLFKDGKYLKTTEDHRPLGEYWIAMGGTWGGSFSSKRRDGNHYSISHGGVK